MDLLHKTTTIVYKYNHMLSSDVTYYCEGMYITYSDNNPIRETYLRGIGCWIETTEKCPSVQRMKEVKNLFDFIT
jgi:hypothetical protein